MNNPRTVNLYDAGIVIGNSLESRYGWQCSVLSLLTESDENEIVDMLSDLISKAVKHVHASLIPIMDRHCGKIHPYIDETYLRQVLLPFLVRTIDLTFDLVPPITVLERSVISKEAMFDLIKQNFRGSEANFLSRIDKELQSNNGRISLESLYSDIVSEFVKLTYG
jgi:hypothetical protein